MVKLLAFYLWIIHKLKYFLPLLSKINLLRFYWFGRRHNTYIYNVVYRFIEFTKITSRSLIIYRRWITTWRLISSRVCTSWGAKRTRRTTENSRSLLGFVYKTIDGARVMRIATTKPYLIKPIHHDTFPCWGLVNFNAFFQRHIL